MISITPTGCAILGLIAAQEGSAYELVKRMRNNYHFFWPRAESHFYGEIKLLVGAGLATSVAERIGRRPRTVYRITEAGRKAIVDWLELPPASPVYESEGLLRIAYADFGSKGRLIKHLEDMRRHAQGVLEIGTQIAQDYAAGRVALPARAPTSHLLWQFLWMQHQAQFDWATWAIEEVRGWSGTRPNSKSIGQALQFFVDAAGRRGEPSPLEERRARKTGTGAGRIEPAR